MAALIGDGAHAKDIEHTTALVAMIPHHTKVTADDLAHFGTFVIGINDPQTRYSVSCVLGINDLSWVHPWSYIGPESKYGIGTHINYGVTMTRTKIGHHCTIAPGVTICGDVTIGDRVFVGAGAVIKNLVTIGDDAFIRMGSIVTRDVAPGERF